MSSQACSIGPSLGSSESDDTQNVYLNCDVLRAETVMGRAGGENFPVVARILPPQTRRDLLAIYGFARLVDQIGDDAPGDRIALLNALEEDLERAYSDSARHPLLRALSPTILRHQIPRAPFKRLIEANRFDQRMTRIANWKELLDYCERSANPVGELVLHIFGQASGANVALSDRVCSALQIVEHCQDVAEDFDRGRIYLPASDLDFYHCRVDWLRLDPAPEALRRVIGLQVSRARGLLLQGAAPLVRALRGRARPMIAAYAGAGLATCDALAAAGFNPNSLPVRPRTSRLVLRTIGLLIGLGHGR